MKNIDWIWLQYLDYEVIVGEKIIVYCGAPYKLLSPDEEFSTRTSKLHVNLQPLKIEYVKHHANRKPILVKANEPSIFVCIESCYLMDPKTYIKERGESTEYWSNQMKEAKDNFQQDWNAARRSFANKVKNGRK